ncbi:Pre-ATP-grasp domain [Phytophthora cactorum]|nr:Pre-ATP-grasp domain [Phytophthora cactorum]
MADLLAAVAATPHVAESEESGVVIGLSNTQLADVKEHAIAYAAAHGLLVGWRDPSKPKEPTPAFTHIPLCLLPMQFPRAQFEHGVKLSPIYGRLVDRVSRDVDWLHRCVQSVVAEDAFTARLLELSKLVQQEGVQQKAYLGIHRSDYMLHEPQADVAGDSQRLLQVELNTISSSFACISSLVSGMHSFLVSRLGAEIPALEKHYGIPSTEYCNSLPQNDAITELPDALAAAHKQYGAKDAVVMFVVQPNEANAIDQRWLEYNLWEHHGIRVLRRTMAEVDARGKLVERDGKRTLVIDEREVSVAYFRSAYTPNDYPTEHEWAGRTLIERSACPACGSSSLHVQEEAKALETSFAGLYGLEKDSATIEDVKKMAIANPRSFVLKPQREGGGNNLYGDEVASAIQKMSPAELESYILMERIFPKENPAVLLRNSLTSSGPTISELGMFITSLFDGEGNEIVNKHAGHLLRTKLSGTDEGGVATVSRSPRSNQLFNVVYDPHFDRFFLEDDAVYRGRNRTLERKTISIPWEKWVLPPKSPPKRVQQDNVNSTANVPANDSGSTAKDTASQLVASVEVKNHVLTGNTSGGKDKQILKVPTLDLASAKPLADVSSQTLESIPVAASKRKKTRVGDYTIHFKRTNQDVAKIMVASVANAKPNDEHQVKWNGQCFMYNSLDYPRGQRSLQQLKLPKLTHCNMDIFKARLRPVASLNVQAQKSTANPCSC